MSIKSTYQLGGDVINVIVDGNNLMFLDSTGVISTLEGIKINRAGVLKEFPDLENNDNWKEIALKRLKEHMKKIKTEKEKTYYIRDELIKFGYESLFFQRVGWRPEKF